MKTILAIAVNFQDCAGSAAFARSYFDLLGANVNWQARAVVADNSYALTSQAAIDQQVDLAPVLSWLDSGANLGFFGGARAALAHYLAHNPQPDWVLICNVDIRFSDPQFAVKLLEIDRAMVVAPQIQREHRLGIRSKLLFENPLKPTRPSDAWLAQRLWLCQHYGLYRVYDAIRAWQQRFAVPIVCAAGEIYAPFGALLCLHRSYFEAGATLDHPAFLFTEELFVAEEVRRAGGTVLFAPHIGARHLGSNSMRHVPSRRQADWAAQSLAAVQAHYFNGNS